MTSVYCPSEIEGMVPIQIDPETKKLVYGYYQVDASNMDVVPHGFIVDPANPYKILPKTNVAKDSLSPAKLDPSKPQPSVPTGGKIMPDGFYLATDASLGVLPPNMMPDIDAIVFTNDSPPKLQYKYNKGYVSSQMYYAKRFSVNLKPSPAAIPPGIYYTDSSKTAFSILPYGKIADLTNGYGMVTDPKLDKKTIDFNYATSNYRDISNNYEVQFHDDIRDIQNQNDMYDLNFGETRVLDQNGDMIILPKAGAQSSVTYYHPGEFPFGSATYVPNYEDSVYLSNVGYRTKFGEKDDSGEYEYKKSTCKAYGDLKRKMDNYCGGVGSY